MTLKIEKAINLAYLVMPRKNEITPDFHCSLLVKLIPGGLKTQIYVTWENIFVVLGRN